jgi:hypothetical protein
MATGAVFLLRRTTRRITAFVGTIAVVCGSVGGMAGSAAAVDGVPYAPTNLRASIVNTTQVVLRWTAPTGTVPLVGYAVYRNGVEVPAAVSAIGSVGEATATLSTQPVGRDIHFQVQAIATSGVRSVKTAPIVVNIAGVKPTVPADVAVTPRPNGQPVLSWSPSVDGVGAITYLVFRNGVLASTRSTTTVSFDSEPVAVDLYYQVQARDQSGNVSVKTAPVRVRIPGPDTVRPAIPTDIRTDLRLNATVEVSWTRSTDNVGVVGYSVFVNGTEVAQTTERSIRLLNQPRGVTLGYQVQAFDAAGNRSAKTLPVYLAF